jgi:hypothetical protein
MNEIREDFILSRCSTFFIKKYDDPNALDYCFEYQFNWQNFRYGSHPAFPWITRLGCFDHYWGEGYYSSNCIAIVFCHPKVLDFINSANELLNGIKIDLVNYKEYQVTDQFGDKKYPAVAIMVNVKFNLGKLANRTKKKIIYYIHHMLRMFSYGEFTNSNRLNNIDFSKDLEVYYDELRTTFHDSAVDSYRSICKFNGTNYKFSITNILKAMGEEKVVKYLDKNPRDTRSDLMTAIYLIVGNEDFLSDINLAEEETLYSSNNGYYFYYTKNIIITNLVYKSEVQALVKNLSLDLGKTNLSDLWVDSNSADLVAKNTELNKNLIFKFMLDHLTCVFLTKSSENRIRYFEYPLQKRIRKYNFYSDYYNATNKEVGLEILDEDVIKDYYTFIRKHSKKLENIHFDEVF